MTGPSGPDLDDPLFADPEIARHLLPEPRLRQIFDQHIARQLTSAHPGQPQPTAVLLNGQPAAGKTSLQGQLRRELPGAVGIDIDMFRVFHPAFRQLQAENELTVDGKVRPAGLYFYHLAGEHLMAQRSHIIFEHAMRDQRRISARVDRLTEMGYRVEIAFVATPRPVSLLSVLDRYQVLKETTGYGRFVPTDVHDHRLRRELDAAEAFGADPRIASIRVFRRGGDLLYQQTGPQRGGAARAAIEAERHRPWTVGETEAFRQLHASLVARMEPGWQTHLDEAYTAARPYFHPDAPTGPTRAHAVTFGRYQVVSVAHLDTVRTMLRQWREVTVGVLDPTLGPGGPLDDDAPARWAPERNPLSGDERIRLWRSAIAAAGLGDRVHVVAMAGMTPDPARFNRDFPPDRFDLVFPESEGTGFDLIRNDRFREQFGRAVFEVRPSVTYHTSAMREHYANGNPAWRAGLAPGVVETFTAMHGPARVLGAATRTTAAAFPQAGPLPPGPRSPDQRAAPPGTPPTTPPGAPTPRPPRR